MKVKSRNTCIGFNGRRVSDEEEIDALDISAHGERGYDLS